MRSKMILLSRTTLALLLAGLVLTVVLTAQTPASGPVLRLTATTENVGGAPDSIRIDLLRWSTDAERDQLVAAWTTPGGAGGRGGAGGAGRGGGGRGGGGRGAAAPDPDDPAAAGGAAAGRGAAPAAAGAAAAGGRGAAPADAGAAAAGGARGGGGRGGGGRGGGRGGDAPAADAARPTPEGSLATALETTPTVGYLWSSEATGYSLRYAVKLPQPDGSERVILVTHRRLGGFNDLWKPAGSAPVTDYAFSLIELRLNAKGEGEGKASLTGKLAVDAPAKSFVLENYAALPVVLKGVKRRAN